MIVRDYHHLAADKEYKGTSVDTCTSKLYEKLVSYKGKDVLAVQREIKGSGIKYVVIPGIVVEYECRLEGADNVPVSKVRLIESPKMRSELSELIEAEEGLSGKAYFW